MAKIRHASQLTAFRFIPHCFPECKSQPADPEGVMWDINCYFSSPETNPGPLYAHRKRIQAPYMLMNVNGTEGIGKYVSHHCFCGYYKFIQKRDLSLKT